MSDNQKNDAVLNEYLNGDSEISRRYRAESSEQTPELLKARTKRAVETLMDAEAEKSSYPASRKWYVPLSLAAVLVLSVSVFIHAPDEMGDLEQYKKEVLARPGSKVKPLPEIKPYETYSYQSGAVAERDPFESIDQSTMEEISLASNDVGLTKELESELKNRNREELETFELDSLRMTGTLEDQGGRWAIILDPDQIVHRVKVGNYMGRNSGKVTNIFEDKIEIRELVRDRQGRWVERQASITLTDNKVDSELDKQKFNN